MGFPILVRHLYIESGPGCFVLSSVLFSLFLPVPSLLYPLVLFPFIPPCCLFIPDASQVLGGGVHCYHIITDSSPLPFTPYGHHNPVTSRLYWWVCTDMCSLINYSHMGNVPDALHHWYIIHIWCIHCKVTPSKHDTRSCYWTKGQFHQNFLFEIQTSENLLLL